MNYISDDISMDLDPDIKHPSLIQVSPAGTLRGCSEKNAHLKGRRRYKADLDDLKEECKAGFMYRGLFVKSRSLRDGVSSSLKASVRAATWG